MHATTGCLHVIEAVRGWAEATLHHNVIAWQTSPKCCCCCRSRRRGSSGRHSITLLPQAMLLRSGVLSGVGSTRLCVVAQQLSPSPNLRSVAREIGTLAMASKVPSVKLSSGHRIPLIGLGTSGLSGDKATQATDSALQLGYKVRPDKPFVF